MFEVRVTPSYYVHHCREYRDQESRGLFGCHLYLECSACKVEYIGLDLWGENGHKQMTVRGDDLEHIRRVAELRKFRAVPSNGSIFYVGGEAESANGGETRETIRLRLDRIMEAFRVGEVNG